MAALTTLDQRTGADVRVVVQQTIGDLTLSRSAGVPFLASLMGVRSVTCGAARSALGFDAGRPALSGGIGMLDVAVLADLALGAALRLQAGSDRLLPTIALTLTLQLGPAMPHPDVTVRTWDGEITHRVGAARGEFVLDGEVVGHCLATFAVGARGAESTPLPWERGAPRQDTTASVGSASAPDAAGLTPDERGVVDAVGELARAGAPAGRGRRRWWRTAAPRRRRPATPSGCVRPWPC